MIHQPPAGCMAVGRLDEWFCNTCGLTWDKDDPEPPKTCDARMLSKDEIKENLTKLAATFEKCDICGPNWCGIGEDRNGPCHKQRSK